MCHYCGCRSIPLLIDYIAEHERAGELAVQLVGALDRGELDQAADVADQLAGEMRRHWAGEENGLFAVMRADAEYGEYVDALVREHRDLDRLLTTADLGRPDDATLVRVAMEELAQHIRKEEDGLFPASLSALDGADWDRAIQAWQDAHPGRALRTRGT